MSLTSAASRRNSAEILLHVVVPFAIGMFVGTADIADLAPGESLATIFSLLALPVAMLLVLIDVRAITGDTAGVKEEIAIMIHSAVVGGLILSLTAVSYVAGIATPVAVTGETVRLFEGSISGWELMIFLAVFAPLAAFPIGAGAGLLAWVSRWLHPRHP